MKKSWEIRQNVAFKSCFYFEMQNIIKHDRWPEFSHQKQISYLALLEKSPKWDLTFLSERNELLPEATQDHVSKVWMIIPRTFRFRIKKVLFEHGAAQLLRDFNDLSCSEVLQSESLSVCSHCLIPIGSAINYTWW